MSFYIRKRPKALTTQTEALSEAGNAEENWYNIDRDRIDEIIRKSNEEGYKKALERKKKGEDEFKEIKKLVIKKIGMHDTTEHIQHFLNSELDWPLLLTLISNGKNDELKCTFPKCAETAEMKPGSLNGHCKAKHNWGIFKCNQCDFITYRESGLKTHKIKHTTRKTTVTDFHCKKCNMYYKNQKTLIWHNTATHRQEAGEGKASWKNKKKCDKLKKCIFCPFIHNGYNGGRLMEDHYRKHFDIMMHECEICGEKFRNRFNLNQHLDQHDSIYYRCMICHGSGVRLKKCVQEGSSLEGFIADNKVAMRRHYKGNHSEGTTKRMPSWAEIKKNVEAVRESDFTEDEKRRINSIRDNRYINYESRTAEQNIPIQRNSANLEIKSICM